MTVKNKNGSRWFPAELQIRAVTINSTTKHDLLIKMYFPRTSIRDVQLSTETEDIELTGFLYSQYDFKTDHILTREEFKRECLQTKKALIEQATQLELF